MNNRLERVIDIREALAGDVDIVVDLIDTALGPYYGGDHRAHAQRIISTHLSGGVDQIGFFSLEQKMFVVTVDGVFSGIVHVVGKRQGNYKISPLIVHGDYRGKYGLGTLLLKHAESYAQGRGARQMYCTVADKNTAALQFFIRHGYIVAGRSDSHYKQGVEEVMLYKVLGNENMQNNFDRHNVSVLPYTRQFGKQIEDILLRHLPDFFSGIDESWVNALFSGYERRNAKDVNLKFKLIYIAVDREDKVWGVVAATPKKGEPIKLMPFIALNGPAFFALLTDIPHFLREYGRKIYMHITPSVTETTFLQKRGWSLDGVFPGAYHHAQITQQWSLDIDGHGFIRSIRVKDRFLQYIKERKKTLEVRVGYGFIKTVQVGEIIKFESRNSTQEVRVTDIRKYHTFENMLDNEDHSKIVPGFSRQKVLDLLKNIYPKKKQKLGVIVFAIDLVD